MRILTFSRTALRARRLRHAVALVMLAGCSGPEGASPVVEAPFTVAAERASNPTVATDACTGRGYVAGVGREDGVATVFLSPVEVGVDAAAPPIRVNDVVGDAAPHEQAPAQVEVGPEGNVYVLWQNATPVEGRRFPASDLRFAVSADGGRTFRPAITVNDDAGGRPSSHAFHDLAVGADGRVFVSWIDSRVRDGLRAAGHSETDAPSSGHGGHAARGGDAALPGPEIRVAVSVDGGRTFGASRVVDGESCPCCRTALAVGPDGSVYVAWRKVFGGDVRDIVVARAAPGALRFGAPVRVHADGWVFPGCPHAGPSLAVGDDGAVHVAWYTGREGRQGLWYAVSRGAGARFSPPRALLTGEWVPPSQVSLAAAGGRVAAAWDDRREEVGTVILSLPSAGGGARSGLVPPHAGRAPSVALSLHGGLAAWLDGESVRARHLGGGAGTR